jgi:hypothetical protein
VEDDHVFPRSKYVGNGVLNRTLVSSNKRKAAKDPSAYFGALMTINGREKTESVLRTHLISPAALDCLLANDLNGFLKHRERSVRSQIAALVPSRDQAMEADEAINEVD